MNQADVSKLMSRLKIKIKPRHRNMQNPDGPVGRERTIRQVLTGLFKYERLELNYNCADEVRGYAERLISDAIRYGDCHKPTMELADYWLQEKQLVHKLFKVLAPRYRDYAVSYTALYKAPKLYPEVVYPRSVLELRGNPFPPLIFDQSRNKNFIHNILLDEARKVYQTKKNAEIAAKVASSESEHSESTVSKSSAEDSTTSKKSDAAERVLEGEELLKYQGTEIEASNEDNIDVNLGPSNPVIS